MAKKPLPTDLHVGARIRMRRTMIGMSQEKLGDAIGLTFQQVQKYEKGMNRVGSSRLQQIANALDVQPSWFFAGAPGSKPEVANTSDVLIARFFALPYAAELAAHYIAIGHNQHRRAVVDIVAALADKREPARKAA